MHTCRFCKKDRPGVRMVKYAARHWAHYECWIEAKGKEILDPAIYQGMLQALEGLHDWQLKQIPVFKLADWLERNGTVCPGKTWVDRAMWLVKKAIQLHEDNEAYRERFLSEHGVLKK